MLNLFADSNLLWMPWESTNLENNELSEYAAIFSRLFGGKFNVTENGHTLTAVQGTLVGLVIYGF